MTENETAPAEDVFTAARWLNELWNSSARAIAPDTIEWQCTTWGSGRGAGDWLETGLFRLASELFHLTTARNRDARDELVVYVPLETFPRLAALIDQIGEKCERWSWLEAEEGGVDEQIAIAAGILDIPAEVLADDEDLLDALRLL